MTQRMFVSVLSILAFGAIGCTPGHLTFLHEPRFTSFSRNQPPIRATYPPGDWSAPAPELVSGYDYMIVFTPEEEQRGAVVIQRVAVTGLRRETVNACGDTPVPFGFTVLEYFQAPAHDIQAWFGVRPEFTNFESRRAIVAYAPLPGTPPAIAPGANAAILDGQYLGTLTDAERDRLTPARLDAASFVRWEHQYQYDGCNGAANAATGCGETHCLTFVWRVEENGRRGRDRTEQFSGPGGGW